VRRFALSSPEIRHTNCMTCGPRPPCHRLGCLGPRCPLNGISCGDSGVHGRVSLNKDSGFLEKGFTPRAAVTFSHSLPISCAPLPSCSSVPRPRPAHAMASLGHPDRFQSEEALNLVRGLLGWSTPGLAGRIRASAAPLGDLATGEFVLFTSYISCELALPISPFFLLLLEEFGLQLQHLTPHSILQAAIFIHLCEMFVGVAPCTSLFCYFFVLVKSGKTKDHIGAYYFQTRPDPAVVYIPTFGGARWENWRNDWGIASTEANDHLILPSDGPALDRKQWRTKPSLSPEFLSVLDRIKVLATGGLTSMHVVGDLLKHRIVPL
jgi:hypothetical protein